MVAIVGLDVELKGTRVGHLFAIQVLLALQTTGQLRRQLHEWIKSGPPEAGYHDVWNFWRVAASYLVGWQHQFEYGVWDYFEDTARSQREYEQWNKGTIIDAQEAMQEQKGMPMHPYRPAVGERFMFVTMLFMLQPGGRADRTVCELCRIPEPMMWTKATFGRLISALPNLNYPSVRSHAIYVRPGMDEAGVSREELQDPRYAYLRKLV